MSDRLYRKIRLATHSLRLPTSNPAFVAPFLSCPLASLSNHRREDRLLGFEGSWMAAAPLGAVGIGDLQMMVCGLDLCSFCALILAIPSSAWALHPFLTASTSLFAFIRPSDPSGTGYWSARQPQSQKVFSFSWLLTILLIVFYQTAGILNWGWGEFRPFIGRARLGGLRHSRPPGHPFFT